MARLKASLFLLCLVSTMVATGGARKNWVMLLSGAKGYNNYSLQSMVFHACQSLLSKGIPAATMVHMNYDDVAQSSMNPIKGNLVTVPNGTNWHPHCRVDYNGKDVTPELFLKVLSGDKEGVRRLLGREGRVIDSGPDDHIFLYMADHGANKVFGFPSSDLHAMELVDTLKTMHKEKRYAEMMLYMEACDSGSMFDGLLPNNINLMATTSAKPHEFAYACCFDKFRHAYVGGQWDNAWAYDTDKADVGKETFKEQFAVMTKGCTYNTTHPSHPQQYGDRHFNNIVLKEFQGAPPTGPEETPSEEMLPPIPQSLLFLPYSSSPDSLFYQDIDLIHPPLDMLAIATPARNLLEDLDSDQRQMFQIDLEYATEVRSQAEVFFYSLLNQAVDEQDVVEVLLKQTDVPVENEDCYKAARKMFADNCPGMSPYRFAFVRRHFVHLAQLCIVLPTDTVLQTLEIATDNTPICRPMAF